MAGLAYLFQRLGVHIVISAAIATSAYFGALWAVGGLKGEQMDGLIGGLKRKLSRR
jgi:hypothetical protein